MESEESCLAPSSEIASSQLDLFLFGAGGTEGSPAVGHGILQCNHERRVQGMSRCGGGCSGGGLHQQLPRRHLRVSSAGQGLNSQTSDIRLFSGIAIVDRASQFSMLQNYNSTSKRHRFQFPVIKAKMLILKQMSCQTVTLF